MMQRPIIGSLRVPHVLPTVWRATGAQTDGPAFAAGAFDVTFGDGSLSVSPLTPPQPATFTVAFGDAELTISA